MRLFKPKQKQPIEEAIRFIHLAIEIAYSYKRDRHFHPTKQELTLFEKLAESCWDARSTAQYITCHMHQRYYGKLEGSRKSSRDF